VGDVGWGANKNDDNRNGKEEFSIKNVSGWVLGCQVVRRGSPTKAEGGRAGGQEADKRQKKKMSDRDGPKTTT
jgi:hypothetical protein